MLAGQFVTYQGETFQVARIIALPSHHTLRSARSLYELTPVAGGARVRVKDPRAADVPLTAACDTCGRPAGFCPGPGTTSCQNALTRA